MHSMLPINSIKSIIYRESGYLCGRVYKASQSAMMVSNLAPTSDTFMEYTKCYLSSSLYSIVGLYLPENLEKFFIQLWWSAALRCTFYKCFVPAYSSYFTDYYMSLENFLWPILHLKTLHTKILVKYYRFQCQNT